MAQYKTVDGGSIEVNGLAHQAGAVLELTPEDAKPYLDKGLIEPITDANGDHVGADQDGQRQEPETKTVVGETQVGGNKEVDQAHDDRNEKSAEDQAKDRDSGSTGGGRGDSRTDTGTDSGNDENTAGEKTGDETKQ